jgi:two-component system, OmpR family, phosphate regulon sensor histidine kinase PhoR
MISLSGGILLLFDAQISLHNNQQREVITYAAQTQKYIMDNNALALDSHLHTYKTSKNLIFAMVINANQRIIAHTDLSFLGKQPNAEITRSILKQQSIIGSAQTKTYIQQINFSGLNLGYLIAAYKKPSILTLFSPKDEHSKYRVFLFFVLATVLITTVTGLFIKKITSPIREIGNAFQKFSHKDPTEYEPLKVTTKIQKPCWEIQPCEFPNCIVRGGANLDNYQNCHVYRTPPKDEIEALKYFYNQLIYSNRHHFQLAKEYGENLEKVVEDRTKELKESIQKAEAIVSNIRAGILLINLENRQIIEINKNGLTLLGGNKEDYIDKRVDTIHINPMLLEGIQKALKLKNTVFELQIAHENLEQYFELSSSEIHKHDRDFPMILVVISDITDKKILEKIKNDFLYTVTHDLRTPLTSIIGFLNLVLDDTKNKVHPKHREFLQIAYNSSLDLKSLSSELTNLSKIESEFISLSIEKFNFSQLLSEIKALFLPQAQEKNIELNLNIKGSLMMFGDVFRLKQVIINLVSNAVKFTDNGSVTIHAAISNEFLEVAIDDTGIGIPKQDLPYVFDKYRQSAKNKKKAEGAGLGLAIVNKLVSLHEGKIDLKSKEGKGTSFVIYLPQKGPKAYLKK